ncbi:uncharacterized protein LOC131151564 [Malania oleifera]|uniref:uncharacterized protein LOC131151564 n=1 Tax=Malania oleifera TaxID=397392 RepID=UPI0025ADEA4B|nr:uncharacterized protein LOC131151564 [Malania oleifera]
MTESSNRMGITRRYSSCKIVKKASSSSSKKTKNSSFCQREDELHRPRSDGGRNASKQKIDKMGPICKSRKKSGAVFPDAEAKPEEDGGFDEQFQKEIWLDEDNSMWLSSNCMSPSSPFDGDRLYIDEWLVSRLSISRSCHPLLGKEVAIFDGSVINSLEDASLVLEKTILDAEKILQEDLREGEIVTWVPGMRENDESATYSSLSTSESSESSYTQSSEDFTCSDTSSTPSSTNFESPSQSWDLDSTSYFVSLVNLDEEDSKWISDMESELDSFRSSFPSPSFKSSCSFEIQSPISSVPLLTEVEVDVVEHGKSQHVLPHELVSVATDLDGVDSDGPIFWPFEQNFDWDSELSWDYFCTSPRNDRDKVGASERTFLAAAVRSFPILTEDPCPSSIASGPLSQSSSPHSTNKDSKKGCRRSLVFSSRSKVMEWKRRSKSEDLNATLMRSGKPTKKLT